MADVATGRTVAVVKFTGSGRAGDFAPRWRVRPPVLPEWGEVGTLLLDISALGLCHMDACRGLA